MGLFDLFTGDPAKKAAAENTARLNQLQTTGNGYIDTGTNNAIGALNTAKGYYDPLTALGNKYGGATDLYMNSLGVNGAAGNTAATNAFQTSPGYQFGVDQSLNALDRRAASRGLLGSGNNTLDTLNTVHGLADQEYGNWQNKLAGFVSPELSATSGAASGLAGLQAAQAPVYTNDATQRVGLASGVTTGVNDQNTQSANAQLAGSKNLWGLGMAAAQLAAGVPPTAMLGGAPAKPAPASGNLFGGSWFGG